MMEVVISVLLVLSQSAYSRIIISNPEENGEYFQGDIVGKIPSMSVTRSGLIDTRFRWPNGLIPYEFEKAYPRDMRSLVENAMRHISSRTCIRFVEKTNQRDYISITGTGGGCSSFIGKIGGKQSVSLPRQCKRFGTVVHELIHVIGFLHEQARTDRDDFVRINWANIKGGAEVNFRKSGTNYISPFGQAYDYGSVMHYSKFAFSKDNRSPTIEPLKPGVEIGQRRNMSNGDINKINNMYCR